VEWLRRRSSRLCCWVSGCWLEMGMGLRCFGVVGRGSSQRGKHFVFRGLGGHERGYGVEAERGWKRGVSAALVGC